MRKRLKVNGVVLAIGVMLSPSIAGAQTCPYVPFEPSGIESHVADVSISISGPDNPTKPSAWEGPIIIRKANGTTCRTPDDVSLISRPFFSDGSRLLVTTYSGSTKMVYAVDLATCHVLWHSPTFSGSVRMEGPVLLAGNRAMKIGAGCIPNEK
jgi:hypothetical protein